MPPSSRYDPAPIHRNLGEAFYDAVDPAAFPEHRLRFRNQRWARRVGLDALTDEEWERHFARFDPLPDNLERPLALRYHGHQFDVYNPNLGDGRGFLFAQVREPDRGRVLDLGTKGSGRTPYSRGGDGRLTLKGGVREVLATEMLEALGIETSKSFSLFETGEELVRGDEPSPTRSSVLVRLSHSHIRVGTFQRLAREGRTGALERLVEHCAEHYLSEIAGEEDLPAQLVGAVTRRSARLAAQWMIAGFVHGVLNSDNMVVTGESFDYGPYRFLPRYDRDFVAAYFDQTGLYRFGRQPDAVFRNMQRLARSLRGLSADMDLERALNEFWPCYERELAVACLRRLGVESIGVDEDALLVSAVTGFLENTATLPDQFFFDWYGGALSTGRAATSPIARAYEEEHFEPLRRLIERHPPAAGSRKRLERRYFRRSRPETLLIDEVEGIWSEIAERDDWLAFDEKIERLRAMGEAVADEPG